MRTPKRKLTRVHDTYADTSAEVDTWIRHVGEIAEVADQSF